MSGSGWWRSPWMVAITDVTALAHASPAKVARGALGEAEAMLPLERPYEPG
jgi:hypothetical protein